MAYRLKWEHWNGEAECNEGWVRQELPEKWWVAFMSFTDAKGESGSRELGTFLTKREAMDRVEQEFQQGPGAPCRVLMKDGHPVIDVSVSRVGLPPGRGSDR